MSITLAFLLISPATGPIAAQATESQIDSEIATPDSTTEKQCNLFKSCILTEKTILECDNKYKKPNMNSACETKTEAAIRHEKMARKRSRKIVISHRGSWEFGPENTLAAYVASMRLGGQGNEIDVRKTKDGKLVTFHDDFIDGWIFGKFGQIEDYTFSDLRNTKFRNIDESQKKYACIPSLADVLTLHLYNSGFLIIEFKGTILDDQVVSLLDSLDMWDHVLNFTGNTTTIMSNPKFQHLPGPIIGLSVERKDMDIDTLNSIATQNYSVYVVDDPRGMIHALGRTIRTPKLDDTVCPPVPTPLKTNKTESQLISLIETAPNWNKIPQNNTEKEQYKNEIIIRATAIQEAMTNGYHSNKLINALGKRVNERSIHTDWMYHGLDGKEAISALSTLKSIKTPPLIRETIWKIDPALSPLVPTRQSPASFDLKMKIESWYAAAKFPAADVSSIASDYLNLSDEEALKIGPFLHQSAVETYISVNKTRAIIPDLINHRRMDVRGKTILLLLKYAGRGETWACKALQNNDPHAMNWIVFEPGKSCPAN